MDREHLFNALLALLIAFTASFLWHAGESRVDAYVSFYALEYTVLKALLRPRRVSRDYLEISLLSAFAAMASLRILEAIVG